MRLLCFVRGHEWNGCTCIRCGHVNNDNHNFISVPDKCTTVCSICGKEGGVEHDWDGCTCKKCGSKRYHEWNGCTCINCGYVINDHHKFIRVPDSCAEVCSVCGKEGRFQHEWNDGKCVKCGQSKDEFEFLAEMLSLLRTGDRLNMDEYLSRDGTGPNYNVPEAVEIVHQVYQAVSEKYGQDGLDKMMTIVRHENDGALQQYVEEEWPQ